MKNSKIIPNSKICGTGTQTSSPKKKLEGKVAQVLKEKILELSRPFTPARLETPALFSRETKKAIFKT